jgi:hypothetical protein
MRHTRFYLFHACIAADVVHCYARFCAFSFVAVNLRTPPRPLQDATGSPLESSGGAFGPEEDRIVVPPELLRGATETLPRPPRLDSPAVGDAASRV